MTILIDIFHAWNLGVLQWFTMHALWELISSNSWQVEGITTQPEMLELSCRIIKSELLAFYKTLPKLDVSTELQDFCAGMIGTKYKRCLSITALRQRGCSCM